MRLTRHELDGKRIRIIKECTFVSGEVIKPGATGTIKYTEIALSLWFMAKMDQEDERFPGIFPGARSFSRDQFEVID